MEYFNEKGKFMDFFVCFSFGRHSNIYKISSYLNFSYKKNEGKIPISIKQRRTQAVLMDADVICCDGFTSAPLRAELHIIHFSCVPLEEKKKEAATSFSLTIKCSACPNA